MEDSSESGIFEQIPGAVRPLTMDGDFRLESITYGYPNRSIDITLSSADIDVIFTFLEWKGLGLANCFLVAKSIDLEFEGRPLFLALNIDIPVMDRIVDPNFFPKTESIGEVLRLSSGIKQHLSEIRSFLSQDHIAETLQRYRAEVENQNDLQRQESERQKLERTHPRLNRWSVIELSKKKISFGNVVQGWIYDRVDQLVPHEELPKGKLGTILASVDPNPSYLQMIVYSVQGDTFDFLLGEFDAWAFIHQESSENAALYFLIPPYDPRFTFIDGRIDLVNAKKMLIFPGENVFSLLGIPYLDCNKNTGPGELYHLVVKNLPTLREAFSPKMIGQTYTKLTSMDGKIDNEIQRTVQKFFSRALRREQSKITKVNG